MEQGTTHLRAIFSWDPSKQEIGGGGPRATIGDKNGNRGPADPRRSVVEGVSRGVYRSGAIESGHSQQGGLADSLRLTREEWFESGGVLRTPRFRQSGHVPPCWSAAGCDPVALGRITAKPPEPVLCDGSHHPGAILKMGQHAVRCRRRSVEQPRQSLGSYSANRVTHEQEEGVPLCGFVEAVEVGERVLADANVGVTKAGLDVVGCRVWVSTEEMEPREPALRIGTMDGGLDQSLSADIRVQRRIENLVQPPAATPGIDERDERQYADQRQRLNVTETFCGRLGHLWHPIAGADHPEPNPQRF